MYRGIANKSLCNRNNHIAATLDSEKKGVLQLFWKENDMNYQDTTYPVEFVNSREKTEISLSLLVRNATDFLEHFAEEYLVGKAFYGIVGEGGGEIRLGRLLSAAGYEDNMKGFFSEVIEHLKQANSSNGIPIAVNGVPLPNLFVLSLLETIIPGNRFVSVREVSQLEKLANITVSEKDRKHLQEVLETYPVRLSMHTLRQMRISKAIAYQYSPFVEELGPVGQVNTWIGQFHQGLLEQMYQNRVIFLLNMTCPVYCRFCFRKHKDSRNQQNPTEDDIRKAVEYVSDSPRIKEIVITGGDPFLNKANMICAVDGLAVIPHVKTLRLATRSISYYPYLFYDNNNFWLDYLKIKNLELQQRDKRLEIATHFIHPDEISLDSLDIISDLVKNGIAVYIQTPFLKDCNDEGPELTRLFSLLRGAGAELHYIYIPCSPIHGNSIYWSPISSGLNAAGYLRAHLSDRAIPRICTATPIGKIDWHSSGWIVDKDEENENFIWIRTPYTPDYFKAFTENVEGLDNVRVNAEGTLDARFMAQVGDETLCMGSRKPTVPPKKETDHNALTDLQSLALSDQRIPQSIVATGSSTIFRVHETRVEINPEAAEKDIEYIGNDPKITDVVIASKKDAVECLFRIEKVIKQLQEIHHVTAVRLRSLKFNYAPEAYTKGVIDRLGNLNGLRVVNPLRLEIETQFLHSSEIKPVHAALTRALNNRGITVYNNTPLLGVVNDTSDEIHRIANTCRNAGLEFHHIYLAGLPLQKERGEHYPIDISRVIDIATRVRRDGSGREVPGYMIRTELGEVDFGLTSRMADDNGAVLVKLLPYDQDYFKSMDADFSWPETVKLDADGRPLVAVPGLSNAGHFFTS